MEKGRLNREVWGVVISLTALLTIISLVSYDLRDRSFNTPSGAVNTTNWGGFIGAFLADLLLQGLCLSSYIIPVFLGLAAARLFRRDNDDALAPRRIAGGGLLLISAAVILSLFIDSEISRDGGGIVGGFLKESILVPLFGRISATLIAVVTLLLSLMMVTQNSLLDIGAHARKNFAVLKKSLVPALRNRWEKFREQREKRKGEITKKERRDYVPPPIMGREETKEEPAKKTPKKPILLQEQFKLPEITQGYKLPPPELLDPPDGEQFKIDKETLHANSLILQKKLADFGVDGEVVAVRPGPVITMYEFKPAPGVKVRRIVLLSDDLAMALRALSVRILAPIPGESVVGIEIPNPRREKVFLREIIESDAYQGAESKLTLALGKDISGAPFVADLARMPHLLVAGAPGTGQAVPLNAMVLSVLFKASPQDVQFIMIDPKMLELTIYENLPHLLVPVVTDPKKAAAALFWAM